MSNNIKGWLIARSIFPLLSFQKVVLIGLPGLGRQCARGGRGLSLPTSPINTRSFTCRHLEAERHGGNLVVLVSNQKTTFGSPLHLPVLNLFWLNLVRRERRGEIVDEIRRMVARASGGQSSDGLMLVRGMQFDQSDSCFKTAARSCKLAAAMSSGRRSRLPAELSKNSHRRAGDYHG